MPAERRKQTEADRDWKRSEYDYDVEWARLSTQLQALEQLGQLAIVTTFVHAVFETAEARLAGGETAGVAYPEALRRELERLRLVADPRALGKELRRMRRAAE